MCDVIKIRLKRGIATNGKGSQPLNLKTAAELPILKLELTIWSFYFFLLLVASLLFKHIFITSHMTLYSASNITSFLIIWESLF